MLDDDDTMQDGSMADMDFEEPDDSVFFSAKPVSLIKTPKASPANAQDEQWIGGATPDPESDDDTLEVAHTMGLQVDEDEEHPKPVDIARDVDEAEEYLKTH